jgi:hypothetical protein
LESNNKVKSEASLKARSVTTKEEQQKEKKKSHEQKTRK